VKPKPRILCFGEVLWDVLPTGRVLGGAPLSFAYHAARLGADAVVVSCVGDDELGREAIERIGRNGVGIERIAIHPSLPTGTVAVELSSTGQPTFTIARDVAWDEIPISAELRRETENASAIVFGSLAARGPRNRAAWSSLLAVEGPRKIFDVNLRRPHDDRDLVLELARRADLVKLNDDELGRITGVPFSIGTGDGFESVIPAISRLERDIGQRTICVTCGPAGAALWRRGELTTVRAPQVDVVDTIGAGDSFLAALTVSLLDDDSPVGVRRALDRAARLSAFVCTRRGAQPEYDPAVLESGASTETGGAYPP
jgi:fructokinase